MRELKDYFCTYGQAQELIKLGLSQEKYGLSVEQYGTDEFGYSGFLRSQALDFFRDLGYDIIITSIGYFISNGVSVSENQLGGYPQAEHLCINTLIELEQEARNG